MQSLAYGLNKQKPSNGLFFSHGNNLFYQKYIWNDNIPNFDLIGVVPLILSEGMHGFFVLSHLQELIE